MLWHQNSQNWVFICTFQLRPPGMLAHGLGKGAGVQNLEQSSLLSTQLYLKRGSLPLVHGTCTKHKQSKCQCCDLTLLSYLCHLFPYLKRSPVNNPREPVILYVMEKSKNSATCNLDLGLFIWERMASFLQQEGDTQYYHLKIASQKSLWFL